LPVVIPFTQTIRGQQTMSPDFRTFARRNLSRVRFTAPGYCFMWCLISAVWLSVDGIAEAGETDRGPVLRGAWLAEGVGVLGPVDPASSAGGGVDLRLLDAAGRRAQLGFSLHRLDPAGVAAAFASGTLDFALPAQMPPNQAAGVQFSRPYAVRTDVLLCGPDLQPLTGTGASALREALARDWRLGAGAGRSYGPEPDAILAEAHGRGLVRWERSDSELVEALLSGDTQCLLVPRLALMTSLSQRPRVETFLDYQRITLGEVQHHILFNTTTVDAATIASVDRALLALQEEGAVDELQRSAARPILLGFAVATAWFSWIDIIGTIAFALSGVLIARAEGYSLLGALVLAALPAVGGGVLRDLLVGREPIGILASPLPLTLVVVTVLAANLFYFLRDRLDALLRRLAGRRLDSDRWPRCLRFRNLLELTDAIGLAAFTVLGVVVAGRFGAEPLWLWGPLCAALSGAGGGILRDILRVGYNNPALRTSFYAEVCLCWGFLLSLAVLYLLTEDQVLLLRVSVIVTVLGAFATRLLVVRYNVRSPRF